MNKSSTRKNQALFGKKAMHFLLACIVLLASCLAFFACENTRAGDDDEDRPSFDAAEFFRSNIVEVLAVGDFGEIKSGTGLIISGTDGIIIATNLHVSGKYGGLITVRFLSEQDFVNTDTIVNDSIIEVLAFDETLDLCIFRVDYEPSSLYNDLTKPIAETGVVPLSSHKVSQGQAVTSFGNAGGDGITRLEGEVLKASNQVATPYGEMTLIQTTLPITQGCSGGAMFGANGELLGLTTFQDADGQSSYALHTSFVIDLLNKI